MVICDQFGVIIVIVLGHHEPRPYKTANLIRKCFESTRGLNLAAVKHTTVQVTRLPF
jgi:hypothetical protein